MKILKTVGIIVLIVWMALLSAAVLRIFKVTEDTCAYAYSAAQYGPPHPPKDWERIYSCPTKGIFPE
jgi:hypothetical protein